MLPAVLSGSLTAADQAGDDDRHGPCGDGEEPLCNGKVWGFRRKEESGHRGAHSQHDPHDKCHSVLHIQPAARRAKSCAESPARHAFRSPEQQHRGERGNRRGAGAQWRERLEAEGTHDRQFAEHQGKDWHQHPADGLDLGQRLRMPKMREALVPVACIVRQQATGVRE